MTLPHEHAQDCQSVHRHGHTCVEGAPTNTGAPGNCCSPGLVARSWVVAMVDRVINIVQLESSSTLKTPFVSVQYSLVSSTARAYTEVLALETSLI